MDDLLSLKWNNHCSTFLQVLCNVRNKQRYADATLACGGKLYNVHKIVLSSCSDYFKEIFDTAESKNLVVLLKDIKSEELEALLDYMYIGEVNVKQAELSSLIKVAECLQIKGLALTDEEPAENTSGTESHISLPRHKKKRKLDDDNCNISPPAKIKISHASNSNVDIHSDKTSEIGSDFVDVKNTVIKEEIDVIQPPIYSIEDDDYLLENVGNKPNTGELNFDNLDCPTTPSTSDIDKSMPVDASPFADDNPYHDDSFQDDNSYPGVPYNKEPTDWQGDESDASFSIANYAPSDPSGTPSSSDFRRKHQCPICSKYFTRADSIRPHILNVHQGEKRFACEHCTYKSANRSGLRCHLASKHGVVDQVSSVLNNQI